MRDVRCGRLTHQASLYTPILPRAPRSCPSASTGGSAPLELALAFEEADGIALGVAEEGEGTDVGNGSGGDDGLAAKGLGLVQVGLQVVHLHVDGDAGRHLVRGVDAAVDASLAAGAHHAVLHLRVHVDVPVEELPVEPLQLFAVTAGDLPVDDGMWHAATP